MARVRAFADAPAEVQPAAPVVSTGTAQPWPFDPPKEEVVAPAVVEPIKPAPAPAPAKVAAAPAPKPEAPKPPRAKVSPSVLDVVMVDLQVAVGSLAEAEPKHRQAALSTVELRLEVVKTILGTL